MSIEAARVCSHVFSNTHPVLLVSRAGGNWRCLCGDEHDAGDPMHVVGWKDLVQRDATLAELINLPDEWEAARLNVDSRWIRARPQAHD